MKPVSFSVLEFENLKRGTFNMGAPVEDGNVLFDLEATKVQDYAKLRLNVTCQAIGNVLTSIYVQPEQPGLTFNLERWSSRMMRVVHGRRFVVLSEDVSSIGFARNPDSDIWTPVLDGNCVVKDFLQLQSFAGALGDQIERKQR